MDTSVFVFIRENGKVGIRGCMGFLRSGKNEVRYI
jgi:hypothetical protein